GAQLHGKNVAEYSINPHAGDWAAAGAHVLAVQFVREMRARWNRHGLGRLPAEGALLSVDSPAFQVSGIKRAEDGDGVIVRLYNTPDLGAPERDRHPALPSRGCRLTPWREAACQRQHHRRRRWARCGKTAAAHRA